MNDPYDRIAYPGSAFPDTHPDRLATLAHLHGLEPTPPDRARVLELGCGDGANLIALAYAHPQASFLGIDRAAVAIARGRATIAALGLSNVRLEAADLLDFDAAAGAFDAIIAHGLFSWVPEPVRDAALAIAAAHLAPHGVAFFSYLALPGNHSRDGFRDVMRFHVRGLTDPAERARQARAIIRLLADAPHPRMGHSELAASVADELERADDGVVHHDFLADVNAPFLFAEFMRMAHGAGLQFLSEAEYAAGFLPLDRAPAHVRDALRGISGDVLLREQYHDFLRWRGFRQTLLVRADAQVIRPVPPERVTALHVAARVATPDGMVDLRDGVPVTFASPAGDITLRDAPAKATLALLGSGWPEALPFARLLERVRDVSPVAPDAGALARTVLDGYARGTLQLWARPPACAPAPGPHPRASALARLQVERGAHRVSSLRNETIELTDDLARAALLLLDGSRDRPAVVAGLASRVLGGGGSLAIEGRALTDPAEVRAVLAARLEDALDSLAGWCLLEF